MKFNCGLTDAEKRAIVRKKREIEHERLQNWHPFFCLWPLQIRSGLCVWLETIERKGTWHEGNYQYGDYYTWEFRISEADQMEQAGYGDRS